MHLYHITLIPNELFAMQLVGPCVLKELMLFSNTLI